MISIIIPTFNEHDNISLIIDRLTDILQSYDYEIIVVDDNSPDRTWEIVENTSQTNLHVHLLRRFNQKDRSSAVISGFIHSKGDYLIVIDADMQHDPEIIPDMIYGLSNHDIVIGSRYTDNGSVGNWGITRQLISKTATKISRLIAPYNIADPLSGYFAIKRDVFFRNISKLNGTGFETLLDILSVDNKLSIAEVPYTFSNRLYGKSKLNTNIIFMYVKFIIEKTVGIQYVKFMAVGASGILVHFAVLTLLYKYYLLTYSISLISAILVAIFSNYTLNNTWTFKTHKLTSYYFVTGYVKYNILCFIGTLINYSVSMYTYDKIGWILASLAGILLSANWNYLSNASFVWKSK